MHARVTRFEVSPARIDEAIKNATERTIPQLKKLPGFKGFYELVDRSSGQGFTVTLWESQSALKASEDAAAQLRSAAPERSGAKITGVERFEVVAQA